MRPFACERASWRLKGALVFTRLRVILSCFAIAIAAAATSGCTLDTGGGEEACEGFEPNVVTISVPSSEACTIALEGQVSSATSSGAALVGELCNLECGDGFGTCVLPDDYVRAYVAAQPSSSQDGGTTLPEAGSDAGDASAPDSSLPESTDGSTAICPVWPNQVAVTCANSC